MSQILILVIVCGIFVLTVFGTWRKRPVEWRLENMYVGSDEVEKNELAAKIWKINSEWVPREIAP